MFGFHRQASKTFKSLTRSNTLNHSSCSHSNTNININILTKRGHTSFKSSLKSHNFHQRFNLSKNNINTNTITKHIKNSNIHNSISPGITLLSKRSFTADYEARHIGPQADKGERDYILNELGVESLEELMDLIVPTNIRLKEDLTLKEEVSKTSLKGGESEKDALDEITSIMSQNILCKSYIGMGYYNTITPSVILRNMIENPSWYTPYTPYQSELSQGRLEMLVNFQTMVSDLTGKNLSNCSLLDEGTACAEAMAMCLNITKKKFKGDKKAVFLVSENCHVQSISVMQTRAEPLGVIVKVVSDDELTQSLTDG